MDEHITLPVSHRICPRCGAKTFMLDDKLVCINLCGYSEKKQDIVKISSLKPDPHIYFSLPLSIRISMRATT